MRRASSEFPTGLLLRPAHTASMVPNRWHGTDDELRRLQTALEHNCTCTSLPRLSDDSTCGSHALLADERVLDHLLYVYRMTDRLQRAEWSGVQGAVSIPLDRWLKS
jgi:hypothetical protein